MNMKGMVFNYNPFPPIIGKKSGRMAKRSKELNVRYGKLNNVGLRVRFPLVLVFQKLSLQKMELKILLRFCKENFLSTKLFALLG